MGSRANLMGSSVPKSGMTLVRVITPERRFAVRRLMSSLKHDRLPHSLRLAARPCLRDRASGGGEHGRSGGVDEEESHEQHQHL